MAATKDDVISFIDNMSVLEMSEFVKELEDKAYAPWARRYVLQFALPPEGEITIAYELQYGVYADASESSS